MRDIRYYISMIISLFLKMKPYYILFISLCFYLIEFLALSYHYFFSTLLLSLSFIRGWSVLFLVPIWLFCHH